MRGGIILSIMYFLMGLGVLVAFISPLNAFIGMAEQSTNLNCVGYIYNGNVNSSLSFNSTLNSGASGSPLACLALSLYLPYIFLVFLIAGMASVLGGQSASFLGLEPDVQGYPGGYG